MKLFDKIKDSRAWGISDKQKVPLYMGDFLVTEDPHDIRPVETKDMDHLPTLTELNSSPYLRKTNRAYHLNAGKNLIIGFDIENYEGKDYNAAFAKGQTYFKNWLKTAPHRTDPAYLAWFAKQPAQYREFSLHYGIHTLYQLDRHKLTDQALDMIANRTEYKFKGVVNGKKLEYELMLNKHWLTMTRNTFGEFSDLSDPVPQWIYDILNNVSKDWHKKYVETKNIDVAKSASELAKWIANWAFLESYKDDLRENYSVDDFNNDDSLYEWGIAIRLSGHLYRKLPNMNDMARVSLISKFKLTVDEIPDSDKVWAISLALSQCVPKRKKDNEYRNGLPWLVSVSSKAWSYIISNN